MKQIKKQRYFVVYGSDGEYYNFWKGYGDFNKHIQDGWIATIIEHNPDMQEAKVLFEKEFSLEELYKENKE